MSSPRFALVRRGVRLRGYFGAMRTQKSEALAAAAQSRAVRTLALAAASAFISLSAAAALGNARIDGRSTALNMEAAQSLFRPRAVQTEGRVTVDRRTVDYRAVAGTLIVHPKEWDDADGTADTGNVTDLQAKAPLAAMFYVAYFKKVENPTTRPITFLFNGGPGSSTVWLHMGAFGPVRVVTRTGIQTPPAPYSIVANAYTLLDASDLVFIDAPGTGFGRIEGKDKEKAFYGVDQDAYAFTSFLAQFLSRYGRWNSPKYILGESYGTTRAAVMASELASEHNIDLNGVILLSQILNYNLVNLSDGRAHLDLPYEIALPSMAATAWYHHKLPSRPSMLEPFLTEVRQFALNAYAQALMKGSALPAKEHAAVAEKLHEYTGLPVEYVEKADLRVSVHEFEQALLNDADLTVGSLDGRFVGPTMDPLSGTSGYDPQEAAISSAYLSSFNTYVRTVLHYNTDLTYEADIPAIIDWDFHHQGPGPRQLFPSGLDVTPDLATAMKYNPQLSIMVNGGYFDLTTPFFESSYEMHHLSIPESLQSNVEYHYYPSGHMLYVSESSLEELHASVAAFIRKHSTSE